MATPKQKQIAQWQEFSGYNGVPQDVKDFMDEIYDKDLQGLMRDVYHQSPTEMTVAQLQSAIDRLLGISRTE